MKIIIDEKYLIVVDKHDHTLMERTGNFDKEGKEVFKTHGYYSNVERALQSLAKIRVVSENSELSLNSYIKELERITQEIIETVKEVREDTL